MPLMPLQISATAEVDARAAAVDAEAALAAASESATKSEVARQAAEQAVGVAAPCYMHASGLQGPCCTGRWAACLALCLQARSGLPAALSTDRQTVHAPLA